MTEAAMLALQNERWVLGESVYKFEEEFARYCGASFAIATSSGTSALAFALISLGVKPGDAVITSPASFVASANSIIQSTASPLFSDIGLENYTIDPKTVRSSITKNTKVILPVHLYGHPAAMDELVAICSEHGLGLVEDACQAHGASFDGRKVGSIGDAGCFSFYPSKNMTVAGDGGMVVTNDEKIRECVTSLRDSGRVKGNRYLHDAIGFTARLNSVQAAIGRVQLRRLENWNEKRRQIAKKYDDLLSDLDLRLPPSGDDKIKPVYHLYVIRSSQRDQQKVWLARAGVETGIHYPIPIHLQPVYKRMYDWQEGAFPNSETLCREALSLPIYPTLTMDEVSFVSDSMHKFYASNQL